MRRPPDVQQVVRLGRGSPRLFPSLNKVADYIERLEAELDAMHAAARDHCCPAGPDSSWWTLDPDERRTQAAL